MAVRCLHSGHTFFFWCIVFQQIPRYCRRLFWRCPPLENQFGPRGGELSETCLGSAIDFPRFLKHFGEFLDTVVVLFLAILLSKSLGWFGGGGPVQCARSLPQRVPAGGSVASPERGGKVPISRYIRRLHAPSSEVNFPLGRPEGGVVIQPPFIFLSWWNWRVRGGWQGVGGGSQKRRKEVDFSIDSASSCPGSWAKSPPRRPEGGICFSSSHFLLLGRPPRGWGAGQAGRLRVGRPGLQNF